ncbi:MAG: protein kinase domain-containing protein, partial [Ktedonobacteraceae bacterium]
MKTELPPIGQYALQQRLNREGSSEVWRAYDSGARRTALIKFFRTDGSDVPASLDNYVHTVERVAALHHANIVPIYDVHILPSQGSSASVSLICLAIKYVEGSNLTDYIRTISVTGKQPPAGDVISIFTPIAQALEVAHRNSIAHGNLKPSNILFE